ncbi:MAG: hypothetical protein E7321_08230 [Clostridiales bacterium]|nr:hypothetical protein [Clostridiales bacterium]
MGIITQRRKKRQAARMRKGMLKWTMAAALCAALMMAEPIKEKLASVAADVQTFAQSTQQELTLPEYDVYALQLAVFDSGERAASKALQLRSDGVRCVIWQRERMRIVVSAAFSREELDASAARGHEAYVIRDTLPEVSLRLSAQMGEAARAKRLLETPDALLGMLLQDNEVPMREIIAQAEAIAGKELDTHPENTLYTQLAQSIVNWCDLMETTLEEADEATARSYGAVTMCTLCRELRQALSAPSTASAQRTPSTAADVMPPA